MSSVNITELTQQIANEFIFDGGLSSETRENLNSLTPNELSELSTMMGLIGVRKADDISIALQEKTSEQDKLKILVELGMHKSLKRYLSQCGKCDTILKDDVRVIIVSKGHEMPIKCFKILAKFTSPNRMHLLRVFHNNVPVERRDESFQKKVVVLAKTLSRQDLKYFIKNHVKIQWF